MAGSYSPYHHFQFGKLHCRYYSVSRIHILDSLRYLVCCSDHQSMHPLVTIVYSSVIPFVWSKIRDN